MPLVIFDLDNTLADRSGAFRRWAAGFVADHGLDPAEAGLRTIWMRHGRAWDPATPPPDAIVDDIRQSMTTLVQD